MKKKCVYVYHLDKFCCYFYMAKNKFKVLSPGKLKFILIHPKLYYVYVCVCFHLGFHLEGHLSPIG